MCLVIKDTINTPRYAIKDIVVYKLLKKYDDKLFSPFQNKEYKIGELYTSVLSHNAIDGAIYETVKGSYVYINYIPSYINRFIINPHIRYNLLHNYIQRGIHAYTTFDQCFDNLLKHPMNLIIAKCTIPKGSWYYLGKYNEIASDQLIINDICSSI